MTTGKIETITDVRRALERNARVQQEKIKTPQPQHLLAARTLTEQILSQLNGTLSAQAKRAILENSDETLYTWFSREANGNNQAYRNLLLLQGECYEPDENR